MEMRMLLGFCQLDYADVTYGTSTLGTDGSFCCAIATVLSFFGYDTDPVEIATMLGKDYWDASKGTLPRAIDVLRTSCPDLDVERYTYGSPSNLKNAVFVLMDIDNSRYHYYVMRCMRSVALLYDPQTGDNYFLNRVEVVRVLYRVIAAWSFKEI